MYWSFILAVLAAIFAFPLGMFVEKFTQAEVKRGKKYLKAISWLSIIGFVLSVIFQQNALIFSFAFIAFFVQGSLFSGKRN